MQGSIPTGQAHWPTSCARSSFLSQTLQGPHPLQEKPPNQRAVETAGKGVLLSTYTEWHEPMCSVIYDLHNPERQKAP